MKKFVIFLLLIFFSLEVSALVYPIKPRYASIKKDKAYARYNASFDAKIRYLYQRKGFPVLIINEHDNWKKIRDVDGLESWMHKSLLSNKKTFFNKKKQNLIKYLEDENLVIAVINEGVSGKIIECKEIFCKVKINHFKGWLKKEYIWGIKKD